MLQNDTAYSLELFDMKLQIFTMKLFLAAFKKT